MAIRQSGLPGLFINTTAPDFIRGQMDGVASMTAVGRAIAHTAATMNGAASMAVTGRLLVPGAGHMDGVASVQGDSHAITISHAVMDGVASVNAIGRETASAAGQMDGVGDLEAIPDLSRGIGQMDGWADVNFVRFTPPPQTYPMYLQDGIIGIQPKPIPLCTYHLGLLQRTLWTPKIKDILRMKVVLPEHAITMADGLGWKWAPRLKETIRIHPAYSTQTNYNYNLISGVRIRPTPTPGHQAFFELIESVNLFQTTIDKFTWGRLLHETLKISALADVGGTYQKSLAQLFKLASTFKVGRSLTMSEHVNLSSSLAAATFLKLLQKMLVSSAASPMLSYHLKLAAQIVIEDIIGHYHFAAMLLAELFNIHPALDRQYVAGSHMAELINLAPVLKNTLTLQLVGHIQVSPEQLVHMLYTGDELLDGVIINALFVSPSGTTTTWAVNTRTNAVTEYMNYGFHSFTTMGNKYIAAGADGLYELDGDTDDGASIIAELMSGYLQLNDKKLFGIKGAYVAIRGGGRFYLKLISGDGREYVYELRAQPNLMTTKVKIGKGISTTYVAFDLITEGQDFDLDSVEFIPMVRGRRV